MQIPKSDELLLWIICDLEKKKDNENRVFTTEFYIFQTGKYWWHKSITKQGWWEKYDYNAQISVLWHFHREKQWNN